MNVNSIVITVSLLLFSLNMFGQSNHAMHFDNVDDYINVGQYLNFDNTDAFTVEAWVKTNEGSGYHQIICKLDSTYKGWGFQMVDGKLSGYLYADYVGAVFIYETGATTISDNAWHHVAMVYNGASQIKLYVDGTQETTTPLSGGVLSSITNTGNTIIGSYDGNTSGIDLWPGYIDELRVWNAALSNPTIGVNYTTELNGNEANLALYYKFDDTSASCEVVDCSPNEIHGTKYGSSGTNNLPQYHTDVPTITDMACGNQHCAPLSVVDENFTNTLFYPNPANHKLHLLKDAQSIHIYNALGALVYSNKNAISTIDVSQFNNGFYFLEFITDSNIVTKRFIVKH